MRSARTTRSLTVALCSVTLGVAAFAPTASAMPQDLRDAGETSSLSGVPPQDLRSPDARDAASPVSTSTPQDLRSPDARDAASPVSTSTPQDLRSPDTRDVAQDYAPPAPATPAGQSSDGFDWVSAAIGVAIVGGLLVLVAVALSSRRAEGRRHVAGA